MMQGPDGNLGHESVAFFEAIDHKEDLIAVVRGHVYVERNLNKLLVSAMPGSKPLLARLAFVDKVEAAKKAGLLSVEAVRGLLWLNGLRDRFANSITELCAGDGDDAKANVTSEGVLYINEMIEYYGRPPNDVRSIVRFGIVSVYSELSMVFDESGFAQAS